MNEKLHIHEMANLLAEKSSISKKEAEFFVKEWLNASEEGLSQDKKLKIKGLGIFKLIAIQERESINVATGEKTTIPAHFKVSFAAEKELSEKINEPFSLFEPTEIKIEQEEEKMQEEEQQEQQKEEKIEYELETTTDNSNNKPTQPQIPRNPTSYRNWEIERNFRKNKIFNWKFLTVGFFVFCLIIGVIVYFDYSDKENGIYQQFTQRSKPKKAAQPSPTKQTSQPESNLAVEKIESEIAEQPTIAEDNASEKTETEQLISEIPETQTMEPAKKRKIRPGERLTVIALEEYGHKAFWVYIYEENKTIISNPNKVTAGIELTIPPAKQYNIDKNDPESVRKALEIQEKIKASR